MYDVGLRVLVFVMHVFVHCPVSMCWNAIMTSAHNNSKCNVKYIFSFYSVVVFYGSILLRLTQQKTRKKLIDSVEDQYMKINQVTRCFDIFIDTSSFAHSCF